MRTVAIILACAPGVAAGEVPSASVEIPGCAGARNDAERCGGPAVEHEVEIRFSADAKAQELAIALYRDTGDVADVGTDEVMDGGYRGKIHLVPQLPVGNYRAHLAWVAAAAKDFDAFFAGVFLADTTPPAYRWHQLAFRFVRSIAKHTPSASATSWTIQYNVEGSLLSNRDGVRETLWHELFHLNDEQHGDWSGKTLRSDYAAIVKTCGTKIRCLEPYAPNDTVVRGGTYYAFQPNNGDSVHEYAAELAVRYYKEQTEMRARGRLRRRAFKCGPPENARAWHALVDEFFGGHDLVPAC
jgi:hypothetical protein